MSQNCRGVTELLRSADAHVHVGTRTNGNAKPGTPNPYWIRVDRIEAFGTTPRSTRSCPLRGLPVFSHFS